MCAQNDADLQEVELELMGFSERFFLRKLQAELEMPDSIRLIGAYERLKIWSETFTHGLVTIIGKKPTQAAIKSVSVEDSPLLDEIVVTVRLRTKPPHCIRYICNNVRVGLPGVRLVYSGPHDPNSEDTEG